MKFRPSIKDKQCKNCIYCIPFYGDYSLSRCRRFTDTYDYSYNFCEHMRRESFGNKEYCGPQGKYFRQVPKYFRIKKFFKRLYFIIFIYEF